MSESTSILELPIDPIGGGNISNNISLTGTESNQQNQNNQTNNLSSSMSLDQATINQIVNGLQQASLTGVTQLQSRDIPMNTINHSTDSETQVNYIPLSQNVDYIKNYEQTNDIINEYNDNMKKHQSLDEIYDEIQTPFLLSVLYFLFQLPFIRKLLYSYLPVLFSNDGNLNINGFMFISVLFGLTYYLLSKITQQFSKI